MWLAMLLAAGQGMAAPIDELAAQPGAVVDAVIAGQPARLRIETGRVDRLTLDPAFVERYAIKPAPIMGRAELEVAGRREFKGRNRSLPYTVAGRSKSARVFWFPGVTIGGGVDGTIGPFALPQTRVTFTMNRARAGEIVSKLPLYGEVDSSGYSAGRLAGRAVAISFEPGSAEAYPVASAAVGALLARAYGGTVSGASWDIDVMMGVMRPVRLLTLTEPVVFGPFRFRRLAVRVPDRIDASGQGTRIAEAEDARDPAEVVVQAKAKGPVPNYLITLPRAALRHCSRLTFDKAAKTIEAACVTPPE